MIKTVLFLSAVFSYILTEDLYKALYNLKVKHSYDNGRVCKNFYLEKQNILHSAFDNQSEYKTLVSTKLGN